MTWGWRADGTHRRESNADPRRARRQWPFIFDDARRGRAVPGIVAPNSSSTTVAGHLRMDHHNTWGGAAFFQYLCSFTLEADERKIRDGGGERPSPPVARHSWLAKQSSADLESEVPRRRRRDDVPAAPATISLRHGPIQLPRRRAISSIDCSLFARSASPLLSPGRAVRGSVARRSAAMYRTSAAAAQLYSASDTLAHFFGLRARIAICARSEPAIKSGSQRPRENNEFIPRAAPPTSKASFCQCSS